MRYALAFGRSIRRRSSSRLLVLLLLVALMTTGCWDKKEFNQMALVQTMAIDKQDDQYLITLQIITPKAGEKGITAENLWILSGKGESVAMALENASLSAPRSIYLRQMDLVLFGEGVLKEDIVAGFRYLVGNNMMRRRNHLLAIPGNASEIVQAKTELGKTDIFYLANLLKDQEQNIKYSTTILNDCVIASSSVSRAVFIPSVAVQSEKEVTLDGGALLKENQLVGWVDQDWVDGYYWIKGRTKKNSVVLQDIWEDNDMITMEADRSHCRFTIKQQEPLVIGLDIALELNMVDSRGSRRIRDEKEMKQRMQQVQQLVEQKVMASAQASIKQAQQLNCEPFGIGQWLNAYHPSLAKQYDWQQDFAKVQIEVAVKSKVKTLMVNQK